MTLAGFKEQCERRLGVRLACYRDGGVERSVKRMLAKFDCSGLDQLLARLEAGKRYRQEFIDCLAVNVTEFFRDPKQFRYLRYSVLPRLLDRGRSVRLWSAGCSTGQEAYSLAMLLEETDPDHKARVVATDVDRDALTRARRGVYDSRDMESVSAGRRRTCFDRRNGRYWIRPAVSERITFRRHDLLAERIPRDYYDLIAFRNVAIHFERDASRTLRERFIGALRSGGVLFLGGTESLFSPERLGLRRISQCCYTREPFGPPFKTKRGEFHRLETGAG